MADQPITGLPTKTASGVAATDKMLGIDSAEGYQILVQDVAKYIIENYGGSTLAGAARTPKAAIDLLNSNTLQGSRGANKNPDVYTTIGYYYNTNYEITLTGLPVKTGYLYVLPLPGVPGYLKQIFMPYNSNKMAIRTKYDDGGGDEWTDWELLPERAEITALNSNTSKVAYHSQLQATTDTYTLTSNHVYLLVGGHPFTGGCLAIVAGWSSGGARITWVTESPHVTATFSSGQTLSITVASGATCWIRLLDLGED